VRGCHPPYRGQDTGVGKLAPSSKTIGSLSKTPQAGKTACKNTSGLYYEHNMIANDAFCDVSE